MEKETQQKKRKKTDRDEEADEDTCKQRIPLAIPIPILIPIPIARESAFTLPAMSSRSLLFLANVRVVSSASSCTAFFAVCVNHSTEEAKRLCHSATHRARPVGFLL